MAAATPDTPEPLPQPREGDAGPSPSMSMSNGALWGEVLAVLAIGYFPDLWSAIFIAVQGQSAELPYWLRASDLLVRSVCISFAVLYLIHRSGESWSYFGLPRPRLSDLGIGLVILLADYVLWQRVAPMLPMDIAKSESIHSMPRGAMEYILMLIKHAANGFAEELVMRAYLITRLELLLRSRFQAVFVSALLFASYHLHYGPGGSLVYIFAMGLAYGGLYLLMRRVWPLALAHMLINVIGEWERASELARVM